MNHWIWAAISAALVFLIVYRLAAGPAPAKAPASPEKKKSPERQATQKKPEEKKEELPKLSFEEDVDLEPTYVRQAPKLLSPPTTKIVYDEDAASDDEPTASHPLILVHASAQSDKGVRRRRNEDAVLVLERQHIFAVADGMGGYRGGEIASKLAVTTLEHAFTTRTFEGPAHESIPRRASELARAIQMANSAILDHANGDKRFEGMGTTICAARFSENKQRLYIGHVGDSRVYCYRDGKLARMTSDHTMADLGVGGEGAAHLSRAVGVWPTVPIDIILGKPRPGDVYVLCSDGLTKMVPDADIERVLGTHRPEAAAEELVHLANQNGGKDNISVVIVRVDDPTSSSAAA
jgi:serine/threonine protein phosphatase PrpC